MTSHTTSPLLPQSEIETEQYLFDNWFDPIEAGLRDRTRDFLQAMFEAELRICSRARVTCGSTAKRRRSRCWSSSACAPMVRKCCLRARCPVRRCSRQGYAEPRVAQGKERLGRLERSLTGGRAAHNGAVENQPHDAAARGDHRRVQRHVIYAATREEIEARRKAFIRKCRLKYHTVAVGLQEACDRLFTFTRPQAVLPSADTAAMLLWGLARLRPDQHAKGGRLAEARHAALRQIVANSIAVVAFVDEKIFGTDVVKLHQCVVGFNFVDLAAVDVEGQVVAFGIRAEVDFGREGPARGTERFLILIPPLTPAACWCARMMLESMACSSSAGGFRLAKVSKTASHTPSLLQRLNCAMCGVTLSARMSATNAAAS